MVHRTIGDERPRVDLACENADWVRARVMTAAPPLVSVRNLTHVYGRARSDRLGAGPVAGIVDVSFDVAPGETLGLVGPSGAGKTTVGRAILRLIEPTGGRVVLTPADGRTVDVTNLSAGELRRCRRHMQMIFQDPFASLNPRMTIRETLSEPLELHAEGDSVHPAERLGPLLETVALDPAVLDCLPDALSGGQRQRVGIARAIACHPGFVVADEPVTALDVSVQAQVLNLLRDLQATRGLTYLFVSHDMAVVAHMADRIAVMSNGRVVELGSTDDILTRPEHPVTRRLVQAARRRATR